MFKVKRRPRDFSISAGVGSRTPRLRGRPFAPGFVTVPFGDVEALRSAITPRTCAFLFEPIQCEAGINIPPEGFVREAIETCRRENVLSIADEIQTGLGRTGKMFAIEHYGIEPDLITVAKSIAAGLPHFQGLPHRLEPIATIEPCLRSSIPGSSARKASSGGSIRRARR